MEARLKAWIEDLSARNKSLEKKNEKLRNINILEQEENDQLKRQIEGLTDENEALKEHIESLVKENSDLKEENESLLSFRTTLDNRDGRVVLRAIERVGRESRIQSLYFQHGVEVSLIHQLLRMNGFLKLKKLSIVMSEIEAADENDVDTYPRELATSFKETLQHFIYDSEHSNISMDFPIMPKLKSLELYMTDILCPNHVNMKIIFPVLQTLKILEGYGVVQLLAYSDPCPTIRSFTYHENVNIDDFHNILRVFPKLTKLNLSFGGDDADEIFQDMWTHMTELESLKIECWINKEDVFELASLFTGIPSHILQDIRPVVNQLAQMSPRERNETIAKLRSQHSNLPSFPNLKKLRHLTLGVKVNTRGTDNPRIHLTDLTAYLALYSMNHLRYLHISSCEFNPECCELLKKGLDSWGFLNGRFEYIIPPFNLHEESEDEDN